MNTIFIVLPVLAIYLGLLFNLSPLFFIVFVFLYNDIIAIPYIIYALIMNIVLLTYIGRFLIPNTKKIV